MRLNHWFPSNPPGESCQHALRPHRGFRGRLSAGRGSFRLSSRVRGHWRRFCFLWRVHCAFTFLGPFAPPELPGFDATTDPLTPTQVSRPRRSLHLCHGPFGSFPLHPHLHRPVSSIGNLCTGTDSPLARQASPLPSRLARGTCRIEFTFVRDQPSVSGCSPPRLAATQLPPTAPRYLPPGWL